MKTIRATHITTIDDRIGLPSSSSVIVVTAWRGLPKRTKLGGLIVKLKLSEASYVSLSNIVMLNEFNVSPAENKMSYGPAS